MAEPEHLNLLSKWFQICVSFIKSLPHIVIDHRSSDLMWPYYREWSWRPWSTQLRYQRSRIWVLLWFLLIRLLYIQLQLTLQHLTWGLGNGFLVWWHTMILRHCKKQHCAAEAAVRTLKTKAERRWRWSCQTWWSCCFTPCMYDTDDVTVMSAGLLHMLLPTTHTTLHNYAYYYTLHILHTTTYNYIYHILIHTATHYMNSYT